MADLAAGRRVDATDALHLEAAPLGELAPLAESLTLAGFGETVSYSRKVFIPLTQLCRDVCHYCTFAQAPRRLAKPYLGAEEVLGIAHAGAAADCKEALFTLGDRPEARYAVARSALAEAGASTTLEYLERMARLSHREDAASAAFECGHHEFRGLRRLRP